VSTTDVIEIERLVEMANQIGDFFGPYPADQRTEGIRNHLRHYWDPRMREAILRHVGAGGAGLAAPVLEAARLLAADAKADPKAYAGPPRVQRAS
jgi:formate dehydrogenase subunit delta